MKFSNVAAINFDLSVQFASVISEELLRLSFQLVFIRFHSTSRSPVSPNYSTPCYLLYRFECPDRHLKLLIGCFPSILLCKLSKRDQLVVVRIPTWLFYMKLQLRFTLFNILVLEFTSFVKWLSPSCPKDQKLVTKILRKMTELIHRSWNTTKNAIIKY